MTAESPKTTKIEPHPAKPPRRFRFGWLARILLLLLLVSVIVNLIMYGEYNTYFTASDPVPERFHSGDRNSDDKIAVLKMSGVIMPPFTGQMLAAIKQAANDDQVKGVLLVIDSPGGLVADSHQIYHRLQKLAEKKPMYVAMQRMAASGGYYIAMGAGPESRIFVEPTTWTGSIGVIIPRYDVHLLAEKWGVSAEPLKTGEFKDSLNPFRELSENDKKLWAAIMEDSFSRFRNVISDNRNTLTPEQVKELATGQIYTASQALENGLVDEVGFEDDALAALKKKLNLTNARVVSYYFQPGLLEILTGSVENQQSENQLARFLDTTVPRAMYYCSWLPTGVPASSP